MGRTCRINPSRDRSDENGCGDRGKKGDAKGDPEAGRGGGTRREFLRLDELERAEREEAGLGGAKVMSRRRFLMVAGSAAAAVGAAAALGGFSLTGPGDDGKGEGDDTFVYAPSDPGTWYSHLEGKAVRPEHFSRGKGAAVVWKGRPAALAE